MNVIDRFKIYINKAGNNSRTEQLACNEMIWKLAVIVLVRGLLINLSICLVACERSFSNWKFIFSRLSDSFSQKHLEAFVLMS